MSNPTNNQVLDRLKFVRDEGVISGDTFDKQAVFLSESTTSKYGYSKKYDERRLEVWESLVAVRRIEGKPPTCPVCKIKMELRAGAYGPFWGCPRYMTDSTARLPTSARPWASCRETKQVSGDAKQAFLSPDHYASHALVDQIRANWIPRYDALFKASDEVGREVEDTTALRVTVAQVHTGERVPKKGAEAFVAFVQREERKIKNYYAEAVKKKAEEQAAKDKAERSALQLKRRRQAKFGQVLSAMKK